jgi:uncharacterized protein YqcC (DUF446 family)
MARKPDPRDVAAKVAEVEGEMRATGLWQDGPLRAEQYGFRQAFGADTMSFAQWLQFILVPRVKAIIESGGEFPPKSQVGDKAFREFVMWPSQGDLDVEKLVRLLNEFDALFNGE